MRQMTMAQKKTITAAKILESWESISLTCRGRRVAFIVPYWVAVAAHHEELRRFGKARKKHLRRTVPRR